MAVFLCQPNRLNVAENKHEQLTAFEGELQLANHIDQFRSSFKIKNLSELNLSLDARTYQLRQYFFNLTARTCVRNYKVQRAFTDTMGIQYRTLASPGRNLRHRCSS